MSSEWLIYQLDELCEFINGYAFKSTDYVEPSEETIEVFRMGYISRGGGFKEDSTPVFVPKKYGKNIEKYLLRPQDVVIAMTDMKDKVAILGNTAWISQSDRFVLNQRVGCIRVKRPDLLHPRFFYFLSNSHSHVEYLRTRANSGVQVNLSTSAIKESQLQIPPIDDQIQIADTLGALDDRITLLRETNATLETIAQALFKSWFVDFDPVRVKMEGRAPEGMSDVTAALFPDSFEESELGLVPRGWAVGSIGKIAEVIDCLHAKKPELLENGSPYLQLNNIRDDGLLDTANLAFISDADYTKWISRIEVSGGDCVITNVGRVGAVAQIPESFRAAMGRNMTAIRMRKEWPYPTYLVELLQSPWMETEIQRRTDIGTILNALNVKNIPLLRCVLAGHTILKEFEDTARPLRAAMEVNLERANNLATLRDTLLPRLISGQLRLPEAGNSESPEEHDSNAVIV